MDLPDSPAPDVAYLAAATNGREEAILTKEQHLDLVPLHHFVLFQLILDLFIPLLPLLLLGAHSTTHLGRC